MTSAAGTLTLRGLLHQPQQVDQPDRLVHHCFPEVRRRLERRSERVPDQPGALPKDPLPPRHLCADHLC